MRSVAEAHAAFQAEQKGECERLERRLAEAGSAVGAVEESVGQVGPLGPP